MQIVCWQKSGRLVRKCFLTVYLFMYGESFMTGIVRKYFGRSSGGGEQDCFLLQFGQRLDKGTNQGRFSCSRISFQ